MIPQLTERRTVDPSDDVTTERRGATGQYRAGGAAPSCARRAAQLRTSRSLVPSIATPTRSQSLSVMSRRAAPRVRSRPSRSRRRPWLGRARCSRRPRPPRRWSNGSSCGRSLGEDHLDRVRVEADDVALVRGVLERRPHVGRGATPHDRVAVFVRQEARQRWAVASSLAVRSRRSSASSSSVGACRSRTRRT